MSELIGIYTDVEEESRLVARCRLITKRKASTSAFQYDPSWLEYEGRFALDPENLPLVEAPVFTRTDKSCLPGAIRDTAPDRWGQKLIQRAFRKAGADHHLTEFDYLLGINDETRIGALRYRRADEESFDHDIDGYRIPPLIQLPALLDAANAVANDSETDSELRMLLNEGSPLGGARPKSVVQDGDDLAIAKFPKPDDIRSIAHGEVLALRLAEAAGINAASARLEEVAGRSVSIIRRFDRDGANRIPFLSAMSLLGKSDGDQASYTDIAEMIRRHSSAPTDDLHELYRRMVFNVLISNHDDHLRNHAFLYDKGDQWRLSPAYDLNPVPSTETDGTMATAISDKGDEASLDLALEAAPHFKLKREEAKAVIGAVATVVKDWPKLAGKLGMSAADQKAYTSAFKIADTY
ncbi:MAG: phosphatidylinositol kinase [Hyphococcus sp.]|nr:MAG: phosphatidylinositol kinase [Marinicaulis sp.]